MAYEMRVRRRGNELTLTVCWDEARVRAATAFYADGIVDLDGERPDGYPGTEAERVEARQMADRVLSRRTSARGFRAR